MWEKDCKLYRASIHFSLYFDTAAKLRRRGSPPTPARVSSRTAGKDAVFTFPLVCSAPLLSTALTMAWVTTGWSGARDIELGSVDQNETEMLSLVFPRVSDATHLC